MNLTPSFERETGQVILEGLPSGVAGEAPLIPVPGLDLAFDRADGRLCRVVVDTVRTDGFIAVGEHAAAIFIQLFGVQAPSVVSEIAADTTAEPTGAHALSPRPVLAGTLSSLARLDAARATSPAPPGSPWWAAEAAELAERAGLSTRASAEAHHALAKLLRQLDSIDTSVLPEPATRAALAVAAITAAHDPAAATRLREAIGRRSGPPAAAPPPMSGFDVAAEVESLEKDRVRLAGLQWMLDPGLVPEGLFRPGLSPYSDLSVRHEGAEGRVVVEAVLAPDADCGALSRCLVRLVDPDVRRVLAQAAFTKTAPDRVRAKLQPPFPLDELPESWIEVVQDKLWPVRSVKGHRIRRALRWADAALRAERAPAGLAPRSARDDWAALAATAWDRCRRDWEAAGDDHRVGQAVRRQAVPQPPIDGPAYLAEALGR
ncbi:MAG TPA: hypothetical protein VHS32_27875 [Streptosporangiaceae bacterium]|jgi:hypothetical protein|nr:hypothetical protein [Streptosporangiaceae bacterium]